MIVSQYPCERQLLLQFRCALYSFFSILVKTKKKLEFFNQIFFSNFLFLFSDRKKIRILGCIDFPKNKKKKGRWLKWFQVPNIPRVPQLIGTGMVLGLVPYHFAPQVLYGVHILFWRPREKFKGDFFVLNPLLNNNAHMDGSAAAGDRERPSTNRQANQSGSQAVRSHSGN